MSGLELTSVCFIVCCSHGVATTVKAHKALMRTCDVEWLVHYAKPRRVLKPVEDAVPVTGSAGASPVASDAPPLLRSEFNNINDKQCDIVFDEQDHGVASGSRFIRLLERNRQKSV